MANTSKVLTDSLHVLNMSPKTNDSQVPHVTNEQIFEMLNKINTNQEIFMASMKDVINKVSKLEVVVSEHTVDISNIKKSMSENQADILGTSNLFDGLNDELTATNDNVTSLANKLNKIEHQVISLDKNARNATNSKLRDELLDLQCRSMRQNLLFRGLPESDGENCEDVVKDFITSVMKIRSDVRFDRVHRIGAKQSTTVDASGGDIADIDSNVDQPQANGGNSGATVDVNPLPTRPRTIVARFTLFKDREMVHRKSFSTLKGTPYGVFEQFPAEIEARRRLLYPKMKAARLAKRRVRLVRDRLFIDNVEVDPPVRDELVNNQGTPPSANSTGRKKRRRPNTPNNQ